MVHSAAILIVALGACQTNQTTICGKMGTGSPQTITPPPPARNPTSTPDHPQAISLLGWPLYAPALPPDVFARRERELAEARYEYDRDPHDTQAIIWLGRRLAYLGRYDEAIDVFSNGLAVHPDSAELLRHRGHRYITIRQFDDAVADLARAAAIVENADDRIEPDGQPNPWNQPRSTLKTNIEYHLGLAHYLKGDFATAAREYEVCLRLSPNDDMRIAAAYWLYLSSARVPGEERQAVDALRAVTSDEDVIENQSYFRLMQVFRSEIMPEQVTKSAEGEASIDAATVGYGLGMWHLLNGRKEQAFAQFQKVLDSTNWAAFGHIAAEAEIARRMR